MTETGWTPLRIRTLLLAGCVASLFILLIGRLFYLQVVAHDEYLRLAERQHSKTIVLRASRGPILDRHHQTLAVSGSVESVYALPGAVVDREELALALAPILEERVPEIEKRLGSERPFVWLRRKLPPAAAQAVRALGSPAIGFVPESLRFYPNRELAAHVLGFEGMDGKGLEGVELGHDAFLAGSAGLALVERDARGRDVAVEPLLLKRPTPGRGLVLALDTTIQFMVEKELSTAWTRTRAKSAIAVVMAPKSGEILALAVRPTFNPNNVANATSHEWRNRAVTDPFEPGSTFKAILAAAALEEGVFRSDDQLYAEQGSITVHNRVIHDWKPYGWLTFSEVLQNSSNVGMIKVGQALGRERYYHYMTAFGFGGLTGVGIPGESRGQLRPPSRWSGLSLATMSIGQELSVTAIQLVTAFAALANGGRLMRPQVVRAVVDGDGREIRSFEPNVIRQVISERTAQTLTSILTRVVDEGTGKNAAVPGYEVAGKTGTAQKLDPNTGRYSRAPGVLSFVGFTPADDPRLAMLVLLDEPQTVQWGSEAAAPIFAAIGQQVLTYLHVPPNGVAPVAIVRGGDPERPGRPAGRPPLEEGGGPLSMPQLIGRSLREAIDLLAMYDVTVEVRGRGIVTAQLPLPGSEIAPGTLCRLTLSSPTTYQ
jgi:cell division protein FtsI (penicillin-binding protein 3)